MLTTLLKPAPADLVPYILRAHQHLLDGSGELGLPPTLSAAAYLNLLLDQLRLWHLAELPEKAAVRMLDVYRDRYPTGWSGFWRAAEVQRLGLATEFVIARRMAYEERWRAALEAHTPLFKERVLPPPGPDIFGLKVGPALAWVMALTRDYEYRQSELKDYLLARGLESFRFLPTPA